VRRGGATPWSYDPGAGRHAGRGTRRRRAWRESNPGPRLRSWISACSRGARRVPRLHFPHGYGFGHFPERPDAPGHSRRFCCISAARVSLAEADRRAASSAPRDHLPASRAWCTAPRSCRRGPPRRPPRITLLV